jgi:hypothetical protein
MDGPAGRGSRGRGRSTRSAATTRLGPSAATSGSRAIVPTRQAAQARPGIPDETTQLVTRSTYRLLMSRGLAPDEAANLTAFMCGIPIDDVRWSIRQVNQLLFLRELAKNGKFGPADGGRPKPH